MNPSAKKIILFQTPQSIIPSELKSSVVAFYDCKKLKGLANPTDAKWSNSMGPAGNATMSNLAWAAGSNLSADGFNVDATDDYGQISDSAGMRMTAGGTIIAWFNPRTTGVFGKLIHKGADAISTAGYQITTQGVNQLVSYIKGGAAISTTNNAITLNTFQMMAYINTIDVRKIYINAVDVTGIVTGTDLPSDTAGIVRIGCRADSVAGVLDGIIKCMIIFNKALTLTEIQSIYAQILKYYR